MNVNMGSQSNSGVFETLLFKTHEELLKSSELQACSILSDLKIICSDGTLFYSKLLLSISQPYLGFIENMDCVIIWPELSVQEVSDLIFFSKHQTDSVEEIKITVSASKFPNLTEDLEFLQEERIILNLDSNSIEEEKMGFKTPERSNHLDLKDHRNMCEECGMCYKSEQQLKKHLKWKHQKQNHEFECQVCQKKFRHNFLLKRHTIMHKEPSLKCGKCSQYFKHQSNLNVHLKTAHEDEEETAMKSPRLICPTCGKEFKKQSNLTRHLLVHTSPEFKAFQCLLCEKTFKLQYSLERHLQSHVGNHYECHKCNKQFVRNDVLSKHIIICKK